MGLRERILSGIRDRRRPASQRLAGGRQVAIEALKLGREMLVIPAQLWLALAELAGLVVLVTWRRLLAPLLDAGWKLIRALYRLALHHLTPARATAVVALAALAALVVSQWLDYRAISVGTNDYAGGFETVAPPPQVAQQQTGDAHSWLMVPIAGAALAALAGSLAGRPRLARLLILAGAAVIAIGVLRDAPHGLDEGAAAIAYEDAEAHLLDGFWLQLASGAALAVCGAILPHHLRGDASRVALRRGGRDRGSPTAQSRRARFASRAARRRVEGAST